MRVLRSTSPFPSSTVDAAITMLLDCAIDFCHAESFCSQRVCRDHRRHCVDSAVSYPIDKLFRVASMRAGERVRPENDLQSLDFQRLFQKIVIERNEFFHRRETRECGGIKSS